MDNTKKFIKMCKQTKEIQENWKPRVGDWVIDPDDLQEHSTTPLLVVAMGKILTYPINSPETEVYLSCPKAHNCSAIETRLINGSKPHKHLLWLPTQGQLQEIVKEEIWIHLYEDFMRWVHERTKERHDFGLVYSTPEQAWLAFVMWRKYGKTWDEEKEEWVRIDK